MDRIDLCFEDIATGRPPILRSGMKMVFTTSVICLEDGATCIIPDAIDSAGREITLCRVDDE